MSQQTNLACNFAAIPQDERQQHKTLAKALFFEGYKEKKPLDDGYAFGFEPAELMRVAQYVVNERLCCPFMRFEIHVGEGQLWLYLRGETAVKAFLDNAFKDGQNNISFDMVGRGQVRLNDFLEETNA